MSGRRSRAGWLVALVLVALNLRPAIASVAPLLDAIAADLRMTPTALGVLTALPVVCMGLFAPLAPVLSSRVGAGRALLGCLAVLAAGCAVRGVAGAAGLFAGTALAGAGIAVAGALLPPLVRAHFPDRTGPVTGLYTGGLITGALLAAVATDPLRALLGSWPVALACWALPALGALAGWVALTRDGRAAPGEASPAAPDAHAASGQPWRDRGSWLVTAFMGGQSLLYYAALAWLAARYTALGVPAATAGLLLGVFSATQLVSALLLPALAHRTGDTRPYVAGSLAATTAALLLIAFAPQVAAWLWVALLGLGVGGQFALALTLVADAAPSPAGAARLSGMAFAVGYCLAALGPFAVGALRDLTGGYRVPFAALAVLGMAVMAAGLAAGRVAGARGRAGRADPARAPGRRQSV